MEARLAERAAWFVQQRRDRPEIPMPQVAPPPLVATLVSDTGSDVEEEALATPRIQSTTTEYERSFDDDGPSWPDEAAESQFLANEPTVLPIAPALSTAAAAPRKKRNLPSLESLTERLDPNLKAELDELFRARFVAVREIQPGWFKDED